MARKKSKLYRKRGVTQRSDLSLTPEIASALYDKVKGGGKLYNKEMIIDVLVYKGSDVQLVKIPYNTYNSWITRGQHIKGTEVMLRDTIEEAREKYIALRNERKRVKLLQQAEDNLLRISKMRISEAITVPDLSKKQTDGIKTMYVYNPDGTIKRKINTKLVGVVAKTSEYITSHLANKVYNKLEKTENKHLVFSLSDLRKQQDNNN